MSENIEDKQYLGFTVEKLRYQKNFEFLTAKQIFNTEYPEAEYLIPDFLPSVGLVLLAGAYKCGKSWFILDLLHCISAGKSFFDFPINGTHICLYITLEDRPHRIKTRLKKMGIDPTNNLIISTVWTRNKVGIKDLIEILEANDDIKVIAIDTLSRFTTGRTEMGYQADYNLMGEFQEIANKLNRLILLITHTRKMKDPEDVFNEISGSTGIGAAPDTILLLKKHRLFSSGTLQCISRDFEDKKFHLKFENSNCRWERKGISEPQASSMERQRILDILLKHGELYPRQIMEYIPGSTAKNISNLLGLMEKEEIVKKGSRRGTWYALYNESHESVLSHDNHDNVDIKGVEV